MKYKKTMFLLLIVFIISIIYYLLNKPNSDIQVKGPEEITVILSLITSIISFIGTVLTIIIQIIQFKKNEK